MSDKSSVDVHSPEQARAVLRAYIARMGLKTSKQRETIVDVFFQSGGHLSVEALWERVKAHDKNIGQATVYRTMKLLTACGLAEPRQFGEGHTRYEAALGHDEHHDHLICTVCGDIVEFVDAQIESLQNRVAARHGFVVSHHKMELYGTCANCQKSAAPGHSLPPGARSGKSART